MRRISRVAPVVAAAASLLAASASADEGMWLMNRLPADHLKSRYGFEPSPGFQQRMMRSIVHFGGGTGSVVSADGLVMTNHHVASGQIAKLSSKENDYLRDGFRAASLDQELPCKDLQVRILRQIDDVTGEVNASAAPEMDAAASNAARRKKMTELEKQWQDRTGLQCTVVSLWGGARYHMYCYKRYTDLRLVFAPEQDAASFGGDTDNFEYPRYCLDATFLRIYENGAPISTDDFLRWSENGSREGELGIVFGHPGRTRRGLTADHLAMIRDVTLPEQLSNTWRREVQLQTFSGRSAEHERIARNSLRGTANGRKANTGRLLALQDPATFAAKAAEDRRLRDWVNADPERASKWGDGWSLVEQALETGRKLSEETGGIGRISGGSTLSGYAMTITRLADELPKPSGERLREYRDTALPSLYVGLYSPAPIYDTLETYNLANALSWAMVDLGPDHPLLREALAGKSPQARAEELIATTTLKDPAERKRLVEGGRDAVDKSSDPLIRIARLLDPELRRIRKLEEDTVSALEREGYAKINEARFALDGENVWPDATGTLRMSFGPVIGYEQAGERIEPFTDIAGVFQRAELRSGEEDFRLARSWSEAKSRLKMDTPFNFVLTADIIGGNSGSPVVNSRGEVTGLIFDGNVQSLAGDFVYEDRQARAVAVDSRGIIEALRSVYSMQALADELTAGVRTK